MKKLLLSFILFIFCSIVFAQAPQKLSYQAMIRNNNNSLIINQTIGMRISIIQGTINGSIVYIERQTPTTNNIGLISIEIGSNPSGLNFNTINWAQGPFFIKTEIDPTGGNNYTINGASELLSVPYALYADKAKTITGVLPIANGGTGASNLNDLKTNIGINLKANLNSPSFSGTPVAPTATTGTNTAQLATTAFVNRSITKAAVLPATTTTNGTIKLAGDLGGTADLPIILDDKITTNKIANNNVTNEKILSLDANKITGTLSVAKGGTGDTSIAGLKTTLKIDKVDNTSDIDKPLSALNLAALNLKLNKADTLLLNNRINSKLSKSDTVSLSNRINTKLAITDTAGLSNRINTKLAKTDTAGLSNRINTKASINNPTFTGTVNGITKTMVGLGNVDNTSDLNKPISTAEQTALNLKLNKADTVTLSNRINTKLAKTDTAGLSNRINTKAPINNPTFTGTVNGITKAMVGLGNVDNTTDAAKPISTATQTALDLKANSAATQSALNLKLNSTDTAGLRNGINARATIASPTFTGTVNGISKSMVGLGNVDNTTDAAKPVSTATQTALDLKAPIANPTFTGTVNGITSAMVGLGNVDNTSDLLKPISTATQTALDLKANSATTQSALNLKLNSSDTAGLRNGINARATIASPTFTGTVNGITKSMVGLSNVDNTADAAKPISTATQTALDLKANSAATQSALDLKAPIANPTFTGTVAGIDKTMVGLSNVDNTSDAAKPVSTATQTALDLKAPLASPTFTGTVAGITKTMVGLEYVNNTSDLDKPVSTLTQAALDLKATIESPTFTGTPTLPTGTIGVTQTAGDNTTALATTAFVTAANASNAQNFVDLTTSQTIAGAKTFSSDISVNGLTIGSNGNSSMMGRPYSSTIVGYQATVGSGYSAAGESSVFGYKASATGPQSIAIGSEATANQTQGISIGYHSSIGTGYGFAIGSYSQSNGMYSVALGPFSLTSGNYSVALGYQANATAENSIAIGKDANVTTANTIQLGNTDVSNVKTSGTLTAGTITYPNSAGTANQVLITDGTGLASWSTPTTPTATTVGLNNVNNTSDADKPVSTATQTALDLKAPLASPTFTGTPTLPTGTIGVTQTAGNSTTALATTAFVQTALNTAFTNEESDEATATGGETSFTLSNTPGTNSKVKMFINGIRISKTAYTISGTTLTYIPANNGAYALVAGDRIQFDFSY